MKLPTLYDTTLRDGNQAMEISFSLTDKIAVAKKLDGLGIHYIEGGWPNPSNRTDVEFFERIRKEPLKTARIAAFGSTRRPKVNPRADATMKCLVATKAKVITIFGKSWDLHVTHVLNTTLEENLAMVGDSVAYLKAHAGEVIYDAEHFFDGFKHNPEYALKTLRAVARAGADCIVLCDTNGGCLPMDFKRIYETVRREIKTPLGVHTHNDAGCGVANAMIAAELGTAQIQGVMNGFGERCGNANLTTIIANLKLKLGMNVLSDTQLRRLTEVSVFISEVANVNHDHRQPYVGKAAFAHKGGSHIDGVMKVSRSFEHVNPGNVGNARQYILSDQAGGAAIVDKLKRYKPNATKKDPEVARLLAHVKEMEHNGYQFEAAEASFSLLMQEELGQYRDEFKFLGFTVIEDLREGRTVSEATIKFSAHGRVEHTAAEGNGPVSALDHAIRKALIGFFPQLKSVHLVDYKVRVLNGRDGTNAKVRVLITSSDGEEYWGTIGVSENIIEASWIALIDSLRYKLAKDKRARRLGARKK